MRKLTINRRQALLAATLASVAGMQPTRLWAAAPLSEKQTLAYYVTPVGDYQVTALLDRGMLMPADQLLAGATPEQIRAWLAARHRPVPVPSSLNSFLINTGKELFLVDSGGGDFMGPGGASLQPTLQQAGYQTGQVDKLLLTHLHVDHVGGIVKDGKPLFENAELWVPQLELDYWLSDAERDKVPEAKREGFERARQAIEPYQKANRLRTFKWGDELASGIRAVDLSGHTPGHSGFDIQRNGQRLLIWGDLVHVQDVQFDYPEITIDFDIDQEAAKKQRLATFKAAADGGYRVAGMHMAFPGLGYVRAKDKGYEWIAESFSAQVK